MTPLQEKMLDLLKEIDQLCRENGINYILYGGTVIGAIRHRGFIPWDDDLDIIFTRENWEKFRRIVKEKRPDRHLSCLEYDEKYYNIWAKYVDTESTYIFPTAICGEETIGCFVDIGVLDAMPQGKGAQKRMVQRMVDYGEYVNNGYYVTNRNYSSFWRSLFWDTLGKILGRKALIHYFQKKLQAYNSKPHDQLIQNSSVYPVSWDKVYFELPPVYVPFEDTKMPVMSNATDWLRYTYGDDWYIYPANQSRTGHIGIWDIDTPSSLAWREITPYLNRKRTREMRREYKKFRLKAVKYEEIVRRCNSKKLAAAYSLAITADLKSKDVDLIHLLDSCQYNELLEVLSDYLEKQQLKRFWNDRIAIDVDHTVLYVACMVLTLTGNYYKAQKFLDIHFNEDNIPQQFREVVDLINATRDLSIAIYDHNDWKCATQLIDQWLPRYPHHLDFVTAYYSLKLEKGIKRNNLRKIKENLLQEIELQPQAASLVKLLADVHMKLGQIQEAIANYRTAYHNTYNGILRLQIEDLASKLSFSIEVDDAGEKEDASQEPVTDEKAKGIQERIWCLLSEFNLVCESNNIPYFLGGYLASEAVELGTFAPGCCTAYVVMNPKDRKRILNAMEEAIKDDRAVESFENNSSYPDFSIRYIDTSTLLYNIRETGFYKYNGVSITIYFAREIEKNLLVRKFNSGLYAAVEANAFPSVLGNYTRKKNIAGLLGKAMMCVLGKRNAKKLCWKLIYHPRNKNQIDPSTIKSYWFKRVPLPALNFGERDTCTLDGLELPIPQNYSEFIKSQVSYNWKIRKNVGLQIKWPYIAEMDVPCEEYTDKLRRMNIARKYSYAAGKVERINARAKNSTAYLDLAWQIARRGLDRLQLWKKYIPQKYKIMKLYDEKNFDELEELLSDYISKIRYYRYYKMAIIFDKTIFRITWELLDRKREAYLIEGMFRQIPRSYFRPIFGLEGILMRKAVFSEKDEILSYLEKDITNCLYMYADIFKYGLEAEHVTVWYDTDELGLRMVVMQYHKNFQVYANRGFEDVEGVLALIARENPLGVSGRKEIVTQLAPRLSNIYEPEYGVIFKGKPINSEKLKQGLEDCSVQIERAVEADAPAIAHLLYMDDELRSVYTEDSLAQELADRIQTQMGRSYIVRSGEEIVVHNATYAESDKFVVVSGLMVHPDYRDTEYAHWIDMKSSLEFQEEGKDRYFFALKDKIIHWHKRTGAQIVAEYGKLSLIHK